MRIEFSNLECLTLFGSPRQRGRIHGVTYRTKIHDLLYRLKDWLAITRGIIPDRYLQNFINETNFQTAIDKWTPGLLDEVRGIAEGANIKFNDIYAFQLLDEEWWYGQQKNGS